MRVTHAVDDLKKRGTERGLGHAGDILYCCYKLLDLCEQGAPVEIPREPKPTDKGRKKR